MCLYLNRDTYKIMNFLDEHPKELISDQSTAQIKAMKQVAIQSPNHQQPTIS